MVSGCLPSVIHDLLRSGFREKLAFYLLMRSAQRSWKISNGNRDSLISEMTCSWQIAWTSTRRPSWLSSKEQHVGQQQHDLERSRTVLVSERNRPRLVLCPHFWKPTLPPFPERADLRQNYFTSLNDVCGPLTACALVLVKHVNVM